MIKLAPVLMKPAAPAKLAAENISLVLVKHLIRGAVVVALATVIINTPVPEQEKAAPARPVAENISNVPVHLLIRGAVVLALVPQFTNTPAPAPDIPAAWVPPVAVNMPPVPAPAATSGMVAAVTSIHVLTKVMGHIVKYTVAMV